jgi:Acetyltransferase (GNAT) domain
LSNNDIYRQYCALHDAPIHLQPWWLDIVYGETDGWQVAIEQDGGGHILGVLPYKITRRWGIQVIQHPPLTNYAGALLFYPEDIKKQERIYAFEQRVLAGLIGQLPPTALFQHTFVPGFTNWLPFHWAGYRQTTRYTYILDPVPPPVKLAAQLNKGVRKKLKKAATATFIESSEDLKTVYQLLRQSTHRRQFHGRYDFDFIQRLHTALHERQQCKVWMAFDKQTKTPEATLYLVYDRTRAHILFTGINPDYEVSGVVYGLIWTAINWCYEHQISLDFEGSMDQGVEKVLRSFGGTLTPCFQITKANTILRAIMAIR